MARRLKYLPMTAAARELIEQILDLGIVPRNKRPDAAHLAVSAAQGWITC